jgi:GGDEF domain-containing protein
LPKQGAISSDNKHRPTSGYLSSALSASIGAALIPDDGTTAEKIIHSADLAMYRAKEQEQSSLVFCEPTTHPRQIA